MGWWHVIIGKLNDIVREALRVLRPGGRLFIWDSDIHSACPDPFIVDLDIVSERVNIHTSYGIVKNETQDRETILDYLEETGLHAFRVSGENGQFCICCLKE